MLFFFYFKHCAPTKSDLLLKCWLHVLSPTCHSSRCSIWQNTHSCLSKSYLSLQFTSVQLLSRVWLFATSWTTACQASLFIINSRSPPKPMAIELVMPSNHLISVVRFSSYPQSPQHLGLFKWVSSLHQVAKVLEFQLQHQSSQSMFRSDFL